MGWEIHPANFPMAPSEQILSQGAHNPCQQNIQDMLT